MTYCPHPHVWQLEGHVQCSACYRIVSCPNEVGCRHLRAQIHYLRGAAAAHANSWAASVESERQKGISAAHSARTKALSLLDKEREAWAEENRLLSKRIEQGNAPSEGWVAEREVLSTQLEQEKAAKHEKSRELAKCSNQLACIRGGARKLGEERDRLRGEIAALQKERDGLRRALAGAAEAVEAVEAVEAKRGNAVGCGRCRALQAENKQYEAGMRGIAYGLGVLVPMLLAFIFAVWSRSEHLFTAAR